MYPYPYNDPLWNEGDQRYWFKNCRTYKYPVTRVRVPFRYLIETNQDANWEADLLQYQAELAAVVIEPPAESPTE